MRSSDYPRLGTSVWSNGLETILLVTFTRDLQPIPGRLFLVHEKRRHRRVPLEVPVTCESLGRDGFCCVATTKDISLGGMYVISSSIPDFGTKLTVSLTLPGATSPLHLPAIVRWFSGDGFGVQFELLGAKETHAITRYAQ